MSRRVAPRILLVEDDGAVLRVMARTLELRGYEVTQARLPHDALQAVAEGTPVDLVVSDLVMPGMSGLELAEHLRTERPGLPILFVSGYPADEDTRRRLSGPGTDFLDKPFSPDRLARAVKAILEPGDGTPRVQGTSE